MISKSKRVRKNAVSVLDIETNKAGEVLAVAIYDGKKVYRFLNWNEVLTFLGENNNKKRFQKIVAHNGGNFDWISFVEDQVENIDRMKIVMGGSNIVFIVLNQFDNPIWLLDSFLVLLRGLNALCDTFSPNTEKLKDFDIDRIEEIFKNDPALFWKYLDNDVISLYEVIEKFKDLLDLEHWPVTAASLAMNIFRERYLPEGVNLFRPEIKPGRDIDSFLARSYAGGRVECFRPGVYEHVNVYDINSLYPYVMSIAEIPDCVPFEASKYIPGKIGFYEIEFDQFNKDLPPVLWEKGKNGLEFVYKGTGVFCSLEIEKAQKVGCHVKIIKGLVYPRTKKIFKTYVDDLYQMRMENKGTPLDFICKILLNSLYGKFAQKEESTHLEIISNNIVLKERILNGEKITLYDEDKRMFTVGSEREIPHRLIHIASIITAMARITLYEYIEPFAANIIYCDTDSVHIQGELDPRFLGGELGKMKLEETGPGVYLGRKQYAVSTKIKIKGLTLKNKLCTEAICQIVTMADLAKIYRGEQVQIDIPEGMMEFTFHTFPKFKSVMRGKKACKIFPITKRVKNPEYTSNFLQK